MGSRDKRWVEFRDSVWLFKWSEGSRIGEDWAEVLASACASRLGLPHAEYHLAAWRGQRGVISRKFHREGYDLVHGNELLRERDPGYPTSETSQWARTPQHTLDAVAGALGPLELPMHWAAPDPEMGASDVFVGYLLLDTWIGNTDRHHKNWGVIVGGSEWRRCLAPTFDHAASLGTHLLDEERLGRLGSRDHGYRVDAYVRRARSALFRDATARRPLLTLDALRDWGCHAPRGLALWLGQLARIDDAEVAALTEQIPETHATQTARRFAAEMLRCNRRRILDEVRT